MDNLNPRTIAIPNKLYFRIGEVSDIVDVKPYVLRYWETEFPDIKPTKSKSGQRLYKRKDVEILMQIKGLLYDERFTINGARKRLKEVMKHDAHETKDLPVEVEIQKETPLLPLDVAPLPAARRGIPPSPPSEQSESLKQQPRQGRVDRSDKPQPRHGPNKDGFLESHLNHSYTDASKVLLKIRKDLEALLNVVRRP